jgi:hypothetical protein
MQNPAGRHAAISDRDIRILSKTPVHHHTATEIIGNTVPSRNAPDRDAQPKPRLSIVQAASKLLAFASDLVVVMVSR